MNKLALLALVSAMAGAAHAGIFSTTLYDDNGAGYAHSYTESGNAYTLNFDGGPVIASGDGLLLTWNSEFAAPQPYSAFTVSFAFTVTGASGGDVEGNVNGRVFSPGPNGTNSADFTVATTGTVNFSPSITIPVLSPTSTGKIQTSPYLYNNLTGGTLTLTSVTVTGQPVPEPASMAALAVGGIGLLARRRRKA